MNIFYLSDKPYLAAQMHCDAHAVKMVTETAQLLSTAHRVLDGRKVSFLSPAGRNLHTWVLDDERQDVLYKSTHVNHMCAVWVRETYSNYVWTYELFLYLAKEYKRRYNREHATWVKLEKALSKLPTNIPDISEHTPIALCMPEEFKCDDPIKSYRDFYISKQRKFKMKWTARAVPDWFSYYEEV